MTANLSHAFERLRSETHKNQNIQNAKQADVRMKPLPVSYEPLVHFHSQENNSFPFSFSVLASFCPTKFGFLQFECKL